MDKTSQAMVPMHQEALEDPYVPVVQNESAGVGQQNSTKQSITPRKTSTLANIVEGHKSSNSIAEEAHIDEENEVIVSQKDRRRAKKAAKVAFEVSAPTRDEKKSIQKVNVPGQRLILPKPQAGGPSPSLFLAEEGVKSLVAKKSSYKQGSRPRRGTVIEASENDTKEERVDLDQAGDESIQRTQGTGTNVQEVIEISDSLPPSDPPHPDDLSDVERGDFSYSRKDTSSATIKAQQKPTREQDKKGRGKTTPMSVTIRATQKNTKSSAVGTGPPVPETPPTNLILSREEIGEIRFPRIPSISSNTSTVPIISTSQDAYFHELPDHSSLFTDSDDAAIPPTRLLLRLPILKGDTNEEGHSDGSILESHHHETKSWSSLKFEDGVCKACSPVGDLYWRRLITIMDAVSEQAQVLQEAQYQLDYSSSNEDIEDMCTEITRSTSIYLSTAVKDLEFALQELHALHIKPIKRKLPAITNTRQPRPSNGPVHLGETLKKGRKRRSLIRKANHLDAGGGEVRGHKKQRLV